MNYDRPDASSSQAPNRTRGYGKVIDRREENKAPLNSGDAEAKTPVELCVLLWPQTGRAAELVAYEDKVLQLIPDHAGKVIQRARSRGDGNDPLEIQVLSFPTEDAFNSFMADHRRVALRDERERAIARTDVIRVTLS
jgi:hypothetical protein